MTSPWPSDGPGGRRTKAPKARSIVPTDWVSGWLVMLAIVMGLAAAGAVLWPIASGVLDAIQTVTDTLDPVTFRKAL
jgi:hypothetical protein